MSEAEVFSGEESQKAEQAEFNYPALPTTVASLIEQRKSGKKTTLNDMVEQIHLSLYENPEYKKYLDAVHSEQAQEGDLVADDLKAAEMIRDHARKTGQGYVARQKLWTLRKALMVVLRRYGISRRERREG